MINYTPFGHSDWQTIVSDIKKFGSAGKKTAVVSTINGDANVPFYKELGNQGIKAEDIPVVAFSVGEEELAGLDTAPLVGHLPPGTTSSRSTRRRTPTSSPSLEGLHQEPEARHQRPDGSPRHRLQHVGEGRREGRHHRPDAVIDAIIGVSVPNLTGGYSKMMPNHHITKPVLIGEIQADGQMETVWQTPASWSATNGRTTCPTPRT
jgi:urea transport system substrate-binding protein